MIKTRAANTVYLDIPIFLELFFRGKPSLYAPNFFKPRTEELVTDNDQHYRAGRDRKRRTRPFGNKTRLHATELAQTSAGQTVKAGDTAAKSFLDTQLDRSIEQRLEYRAQGAAEHQKPKAKRESTLTAKAKRQAQKAKRIATMR